MESHSGQIYFRSSSNLINVQSVHVPGEEDAEEEWLTEKAWKEVSYSRNGFVFLRDLSLSWSTPSWLQVTGKTNWALVTIPEEDVTNWE